MIGMGMGLRMGSRGGGGGNAAVAYYTANGKRPDLVADFAGASGAESYVIDGAASAFDTMFPSFARSGNAAMVDSDGSLKWAPHNLLTYSEDFTNAVWTKDGITEDEGLIIANESDGYHYISQSTPTGVFSFTIEVEVKPEGYNFIRVFNQIIGVGVDIDIANKTFFGKNAEFDDPEFADMPDGYVLVKCKYIGVRTNKGLSIGPRPSALGVSTFTGDGVSGVSLRRCRLYRSDLGGMADNPNRGDSYVPTTSAAVYMPRRNHHVYEGGEWVNKGVLIETEARTNICQYSNEIASYPGSWGPQNGAGMSITADDAVAPDGTTTLDKVEKTDTSSDAYVRYTFTAAGANTDYCARFFVRKDADTSRFPEFALYDSTDVIGTFWHCNTSTGATTVRATSGSPVNNAIDVEDHGDFWAVTITLETGASGANTIWLMIRPAAGTTFGTFDAAVTGFIHVGFVQIEVGLTPSSYIPTAGSTVTRAAETLPIAAANLPYSATAMSIAMKGRMTYADTDAGPSSSGGGFLCPYLWKAGSSDWIDVSMNAAGSRTGQMLMRQREGTSGLDSVGTSTTAFSPGVNVPFAIASRHGATFINGAVGGTALTEDTTPTALPDLSATNLDLGQDFMGTISSFVMWDEDIADAGIEEASA